MPAEPTSRRARGLELTQPHFAAHTKRFQHEGQNATKITCALTDTCIQFLGLDFGKDILLSLVLITIFLTVCHLLFSPSFGSISSSKPIGVRKVNRWPKSAGQRREDHYYEALAFSRHNIDLVFGEENMKPEQLTKARENAGIDLSTERVSKWYQESTRKDDDPLCPFQIA